MAKVSTKRLKSSPKRKIKRVSVLGQGKVGLTLSACLLDAGFDVVGVDVSEKLIHDINEGEIWTDEPGVMDRLRKSKKKFSATLDGGQAVADTDFTFIIVPTPSNALGGFSLRFLKKACETVGKAVKKKNKHHVVAIISTMLPGSSDCIILPILEKAIGKKVGNGWGYCYNPVFIALGEIVKGFIQPDYVLIGESDKKAGDVVWQVHQSMIKDKKTQKETPTARMSPIEAEITKIASNTHETMRVTFANMLFALCSEIPGTNVDRITGALSFRMGRRFFRGAVPYGGPCWPRDNVALAVFMDAVGVPNLLPRTVHFSNDEHGKYVLRKILEVTKPDETLGLVGMAYKPGTPVIDCSFSVKLAGWLAKEGRRVVAWDPLALPLVRSCLGEKIEYAEKAQECLQHANTVILLNMLPEFKNWKWSVGNRMVIDCWRCLAPNQIKKIKRYFPLGQSPSSNRVQLMKKINMERLKLLTD